jgi:hypothetical protein
MLFYYSPHLYPRMYQKNMDGWRLAVCDSAGKFPLAHCPELPDTGQVFFIALAAGVIAGARVGDKASSVISVEDVATILQVPLSSNTRVSLNIQAVVVYL